MNSSLSTNDLELFEGGEEYFPRLFKEIDRAKSEILIECYMLVDDAIGLQLIEHLEKAARRGVRVSLILDSLGSSDLSASAIQRLRKCEIEVYFFRPFQWQTMGRFFFRRLHRKTIIIDQTRAFVGGINLAKDYLVNHPRIGKWDLAVMVKGPAAKDIYFHAAALRQWMRQLFGGWFHRRRRLIRDIRRRFFQRQRTRPQIHYVIRDNLFLHRSIESYYLQALSKAQTEVLIANAYFLPSFRFLRALRRTAQRGVRVILILQGKFEIKIIKLAERFLYRKLMQAHVEIYEYQPQILHAKVGLVDADWACIGSSNFEPWSLLSNLEGNLIIRDQAFCHQLRKVLVRAQQRSRKIFEDPKKREAFLSRLLNRTAFSLLRFAAFLARRSNG